MNYKQYNDYELIYKIRENDDDSREVMFEKYQPIIRNIANMYYQKYKQYGCEFDDFYQEAMIGFYKALSSYDENMDSLFYTYSVCCIHRKLSGYCRDISSAKKNISSEYFVDIDECSVEDPSSNTETIIKGKNIDLEVKKFLYELPIETSSIMELKWNGFTYREIATLLDIPVSSVEFKSRKARKDIRKALHKYCY